MQRKRRTVNASCLGLYKARSVTCTHTEPPAERGSGRVGDPPPHTHTVGTPRETQGLSRVTAPSVSLKFFHLQLFL